MCLGCLVGTSFPTAQFPVTSFPQHIQQHHVKVDNSSVVAADESEEDDDVHLCGGCKQEFNSYTLFKKHKKVCQARKIKTKSSRSAADSNPNLEATAISLLATQFSNNEARDDTDHSIPIWTQPETGSSAADHVTSDKVTADMEPGSLICLTMDSGQEPGLSSLVTMAPITPMSSTVTMTPITPMSTTVTMAPITPMSTSDTVTLARSMPVTTTTSNSVQLQEYLDVVDCSQIQFESASMILPGNKTNEDHNKNTEAHVKVEKKPTSPKKAKSVGRKVHQCTFVGCPFVTKYSKDLTRHMTVHTGEKPFTCNICMKGFGRQDKLNRHMQIHSGYKPFQCAACDYKAIDKYTLKKHMRVHTDERPYHCQICPYRSKDASQLTVHLRIHTGDTPFACRFKDCSAAFKTNSDLKRHIRTHTGETPYKCDYCDHRVKIKSNLKAHIRVNHRPNEVFKCKSEQCSYVTVSKNDLKEHMKSHQNSSANDVMSCKLCSFSTINRQKYTDHIKEHESNRPFKCTYCAYSAKTQAILSCHLNKRHAAEVCQTEQSKSEQKKTKPRKGKTAKAVCKPNFCCPVCNAGFVRKDSLKSHIRQHKKSGVAVPHIADNYIGGELSKMIICIDNATIFLGGSNRSVTVVNSTSDVTTQHSTISNNISINLSEQYTSQPNQFI